MQQNVSENLNLNNYGSQKYVLRITNVNFLSLCSKFSSIVRNTIFLVYDIDWSSVSTDLFIVISDRHRGTGIEGYT